MLAISLLLLAASAPPPVELPPTAAVFAAGEDTVAQSVAGRVEVELARALKKKKVELADLDALFPPPTPEKSDEGDALFVKGREAYDNLDFEAATKLLTQAAVFFIRRPATASPEQLSEIFLYLGASELQNGAKDAGKEFTRALQMNPALAPDAKYFGSDVQAAFNKAQTEMNARPKGTLSVESVPSGADVEAFGLTYGLTPVPEIELPAGRYMVRLKRPGFAANGAFPEVLGGQSVDVRVKLEAAPAFVALREKAQQLAGKQGFESTTLPLAAVDVGKALRARYLVMAAVTTGAKASTQVELQAWNLATGDRLKGVKFDLDPDGRGAESAADAIAAWIARPSAAVATVAESEPGVQPSEGGPVFKKWWFWTAIGSVAVAAGVTTAVVASQPRGQRGFNVVLGQP